VVPKSQRPAECGPCDPVARTLRLDEELRQRLADAANRSVRSVNSEIIFRLRASFEDNEAPINKRLLAISTSSIRERLPNRRASEVFDFEVGGLKYTASFSAFADGKIGELFLNNHKSNSAADTNARDSAIAFSFAVQHGADAEAIRRALSRDAQGRALGPLGQALDRIAGEIRR
jgi:hypothetical protein